MLSNFGMSAITLTMAWCIVGERSIWDRRIPRHPTFRKPSHTASTGCDLAWGLHQYICRCPSPAVPTASINSWSQFPTTLARIDFMGNYLRFNYVQADDTGETKLCPNWCPEISLSRSRGHVCVSVTSTRATNTVHPTLFPELLQGLICVVRQLSRTAQSSGRVSLYKDNFQTNCTNTGHH